jgi:type III secretion protein K
MTMPAAPAPPRLVQQVMAFNLHPEAELHPSWLPSSWPLRHRRIRTLNGSGQALLADCLRHWEAGAPGAALPPEYDFDAPLRRLALLDAASLRRLAAYCGFAVHRPLFKLRGVAPLLKRQARRYDEDAPRFVTERLPQLSQFAMNTASIEARPHSAGRVIVNRGYRLLLAAVAGEGPAFLRRVQRKLPQRVCHQALPELRPAQREQLSELMLLCIVPERLPQWDWLF